VESWPQNPVDLFIEFLTNSCPPEAVVADFGCGEAKIAATVHDKVRAIHSFDLVAANKFITACDISHVPLGDESIDIAIFCLSLMGTNFLDFVREAHRVLKSGGSLKIAEVISRFTDVGAFIKALNDVGFKLISKVRPFFFSCSFLPKLMFCVDSFHRMPPTRCSSCLILKSEEWT